MWTLVLQFPGDALNLGAIPPACFVRFVVAVLFVAIFCCLGFGFGFKMGSHHGAHAGPEFKILPASANLSAGDF